MVLRNYVVLERDTPAVLHFRAHRMETRTITDPLSRRGKAVHTLVFDVDRFNGEPSIATLSVMSEKLAQMLEPYLDGNRYTRYQFTIVRRGEGFLTEYEVQPTPYTG